MDVMQRVLRILSHLDLKHNERRRARISQGYKAGELQPHYCQEIGLVAFMFFFELLFSYVSLAISFYVSFTNLFPIAHALIC